MSEDTIEPSETDAATNELAVTRTPTGDVVFHCLGSQMLGGYVLLQDVTRQWLIPPVYIVGDTYTPSLAPHDVVIQASHAAEIKMV